MTHVTTCTSVAPCVCSGAADHDRFPATASLAYRAGFLDRPQIDEYLEILWAAMRRLWPGLQRKPH